MDTNPAILSLPPNFFQQAVKIHQQGELGQAKQLYREILESQPTHHGALHMLGVISLQQGSYHDAIQSIGQAIRHDSSKAVYFNNYGAALHHLERYVEALTSFHRAVELQPHYVDALANLGMAYESLGQLATAANCFRQALALQPTHADARARSSKLLLRLDDTENAIKLLEELLKSDPTAEDFLRLGNLQLSRGDSTAAIAHYRQAIAIDPKHAVARFNLGNALHEQHNVEEARQQFVQASICRPRQDFWKLRAAITCPAVFESNQQIDDFMEQVSSELDRWIESPPVATPQELFMSGAFPNFSYSYLGRNILPLKQKFAQLYRHYFTQRPQATGSSLPGRQRLGIVVTQRHEGIFLRCMKGILENLSTDLFEIVVLCSQSSLDTLQKGLSLPHVRYVPFSNILGDAAATIRRAACDILYYWEVGSDALNYLLPFCRLAPVQCTSHGSQISSGIAEVDYFYSSSLMERPDAQNHYAERLWNSGTLLMHQQRLPPPQRARRQDFQLPTDRTLYMSLQNPLKFHPDFDPLLRGIIERDPRATIVLLRGNYQHAEQQLRRRFQQNLGPLSERVLLLPHQSFVGYLQLIMLADVTIDPPHFNAGSSAYDIFSLRRPLVTLPSTLNVGRVGAAFYQKMQLPSLIASSSEAYVDQAVQLGTDRDYRQHIETQVASHSDLLFGDLHAATDHQTFFQAIKRT